MQIELLHRILSAELNPHKSRELGEVLDSYPIETLEQLLELPFLDAINRERLKSANLDLLNEYLKKGGTILGRDEFPATIAEIPHPPLGLYTWGNPEVLEQPTIAIVGTRRASGYGKAVARKFAQDFARAGVCVVSGGAGGIDAAAHEGALEEGTTAAVLFTSVDDVYPRHHGGLFQRIRQSGVLVSHFPLGMKGSFPGRPLARNRIIAALSQAVLVVEAPERSGALSTATEAAELGRPVFVVPGMIDNFNFIGSHQLIREGAIFCDHPYQVLDAIGVQPVAAKPKEDLESLVSVKILSTLGAEALSSEVLAEKTGIDHATLLEELTLLELDGRLFREGGKFRASL